MRPLLTVLILAVALLVAAGPGPARAQDTAWVQIESLPTLAAAQERARAYANAFDNVGGFRLGRWYAIALGPYTPEAAQSELFALRGEGLIPSDSYITRTAIYGPQFWPVGVDIRTALPQRPNTALTAPSITDSLSVARPDPEPEPEPEPLPLVADETPAEARRSERLLTSVERQELQEALKWFGHYTSAIDGAFGRGTRAAMASWQRAEGYEGTGVLTTGQRFELVSAFRAPFDAMGLAPVTDSDAGISIAMPRARVAYSRAEAPFVHYDATDGSDLRVLLISQSGDEATLFGLYDIMQTLEIVPRTGPRQRQARQFTLRGESPTLKSFTFARLGAGAVKGFTLVWGPDEDDRVIERVLEEMRSSFSPLPEVLPDTARDGDVDAQSIDLLAGLEIRRPVRTRTGFYVDGTGAVLTTGGAVAGCARITLAETIDAEVAATDAETGLALLRPTATLAPMAVAAFRPGVPRLRAEIAVAGFSYGDILDLPLMTYGTLADLRGLNGEVALNRLDLAALPGDAGGPVFDTTGAVLGILAPPEAEGGRRLPKGVSLAVHVPALAEFLTRAGVEPRVAETATALAPQTLADRAAEMTVAVGCWDE
ncbi:MAG: serine protease [Pseudomonadota bacterium]